MTVRGEEFVRLLNLGDESTWANAFQPIYAVAWKTYYKLGHATSKEAEKLAFDFLKKMPYKISSWKIKNWEELKATVIAEILHDGILFLKDLTFASLTNWKKMFSENAEEAKQRLILLLTSIREIASTYLNDFERRLYMDHLVFRKALTVLSLKYQLDLKVLKGICSEMIQKLKNGLTNYGLGWLFQK